MDSKRIYILGAGSSKGHSKGIFPSINQFFTKAKELGADLKSDFKLVVDYIKKISDRNILTGRDSIDIESLFTNIEIDIERSASPDLLKIRQQLLRLIQVVLIQLEESLSRHPGEYNQFVSMLNKNDTVITFNWDLLLDNTLDRIHILERMKMSRVGGPPYKDPKENQYWQFVFNISAISEQTWKHGTFDDPYKVWNPERGFYLKLHGSVDWFYCTNLTCRAFNKTFPLLEPTEQYYCSECHEPLELLLIPPILNKEYRRFPFIRKIWNMAAKELTLANEVIIWGYRLPHTDFYVSWLLQQAREAPLKNLIIINPRLVSKKGRIQTSFVRRFYNIFRGVITKESILLYESFEDYSKNLNILNKYNLGDSKIAYKAI